MYGDTSLPHILSKLYALLLLYVVLTCFTTPLFFRTDVYRTFKVSNIYRMTAFHTRYVKLAYVKTSF